MSAVFCRPRVLFVLCLFFFACLLLPCPTLSAPTEKSSKKGKSSEKANGSGKEQRSDQSKQKKSSSASSSSKSNSKPSTSSGADESKPKATEEDLKKKVSAKPTKTSSQTEPQKRNTATNVKDSTTPPQPSAAGKTDTPSAKVKGANNRVSDQNPPAKSENGKSGESSATSASESSASKAKSLEQRVRRRVLKAKAAEKRAARVATRLVKSRQKNAALQKRAMERKVQKSAWIKKQRQRTQRLLSVRKHSRDQALRKKEQQKLEWMNKRRRQSKQNGKRGIISLNYADYVEYVLNGPRPYYVYITYQASGETRNCQLCQQMLQAEKKLADIVYRWQEDWNRTNTDSAALSYSNLNGSAPNATGEDRLQAQEPLALVSEECHKLRPELKKMHDRHAELKRKDHLSTEHLLAEQDLLDAVHLACQERWRANATLEDYQREEQLYEKEEYSRLPLFLAVVDFDYEDGQRVFSELGLQSAPHLVFFTPTVGTKAYKPNEVMKALPSKQKFVMSKMEIDENELLTWLNGLTPYEIQAPLVSMFSSTQAFLSSLPLPKPLKIILEAAVSALSPYLSISPALRALVVDQIQSYSSNTILATLIALFVLFLFISYLIGKKVLFFLFYRNSLYAKLGQSDDENERILHELNFSYLAHFLQRFFVFPLFAALIVYLLCVGSVMYNFLRGTIPYQEKNDNGKKSYEYIARDGHDQYGYETFIIGGMEVGLAIAMILANVRTFTWRTLDITKKDDDSIIIEEHEMWIIRRFRPSSTAPLSTRATFTAYRLAVYFLLWLLQTVVCSLVFGAIVGYGWYRFVDIYTMKNPHYRHGFLAPGMEEFYATYLKLIKNILYKYTKSRYFR